MKTFACFLLLLASLLVGGGDASAFLRSTDTRNRDVVFLVEDRHSYLPDAGTPRGKELAKWQPWTAREVARACPHISWRSADNLTLPSGDVAEKFVMSSWNNDFHPLPYVGSRHLMSTAIPYGFYHYASMTMNELKAEMNEVLNSFNCTGMDCIAAIKAAPVQRIIRNFWPWLLFIALGILSAFFLVLALLSCARPIRNIFSKILCKMCRTRKRGDLEDASKVKRWLWVIAFAFALVWTLIFLIVGSVYARRLSRDTRLLECDAQRAAYVAVFGSHSDAKAFKGYVYYSAEMRGLVDKLADRKAFQKRVDDLVQIITDRGTAAVDDIEARVTSDKLTLEAVETQLEAADVQHTCLACKAVIDADGFDRVLAQLPVLRDKITSLRREFNAQMGTNLDNLVDEVDKARKQIDSVDGQVKHVVTTVATYTKPLGSAAYLGIGIGALTGFMWIPLLLVGVSFSFLVCLYNSERPSYRIAYRILGLQWGCVAFFVPLLLIIGGICYLLIAVASGPCTLVSRDLLRQGDYFDYPILVDSLRPHFDANLSDDQIVKLLRQVATIDGSGEGALQLFGAQSKIEEVEDKVTEAKHRIDSEVAKMQDQIPFNDIHGYVSRFDAVDWISLINLPAADPRELFTFSEVLGSGINQHDRDLDKQARDEVMKHTGQDIKTVWGWDRMMAKINEVASVSDQYTQWCFQQRTTTCPAGTVVINSFTDVTVQRDYVGNRLVQANRPEDARRFVNAVVWAQRRARAVEKMETLTPVGGVSWLSGRTESVIETLNDFKGFSVEKAKDAKGILDDALQPVEGFKDLVNTRPIVDFAGGIVDGVCGERLGNAAMVFMSWLILGVMFLLIWVLLYKLWHFCCDRAKEIDALDNTSQEFIVYPVEHRSKSMHIGEDDILEGMQDT